MIYPVGFTSNIYPVIGSNAIGNAVNPVNKINGLSPLSQKSPLNLEKIRPSECQTCKSRKYIDHSDESNVSFKSPGHISPQASFSAVSAHEQEHVSNAVSQGSQKGKELISASVSLQMEICHECGTPYVAGGTTRTLIKYDTSNPYENTRKSVEGSLLKGMYVDYVV